MLHCKNYSQSFGEIWITFGLRELLQQSLAKAVSEQIRVLVASEECQKTQNSNP